MAKSSEAPQEQSFESAMGRLERLVGEMEGSDLPLERLIVNYEEGIKLVKVCQQKLSEAEKKIEIIRKQADGDAGLEPFDPNAKPAPSAPARKASAKDASLF